MLTAYLLSVIPMLRACPGAVQPTILLHCESKKWERATLLPVIPLSGSSGSPGKYSTSGGCITGSSGILLTRLSVEFVTSIVIGVCPDGHVMNQAEYVQRDRGQGQGQSSRAGAVAVSSSGSVARYHRLGVPASEQKWPSFYRVP